MPRSGLKPRKMPVQSRSAATFDAILEAAARILERHGLEGFNTNAVAARAGVSVGSLYQYFPGKDALMAALIRKDAQAFLVSIEAAASHKDFRQGMTALIDAAIGHQLDRPGLARILDFEEKRLPLDKESAAIFSAIGAKLAGFLAPHLQNADRLKAGEVARDVAAITRGLIDAAGEAGETDRASLAARVSRAVHGYLGL
jgi:AcrR family transcriptional regulator